MTEWMTGLDATTCLENRNFRGLMLEKRDQTLAVLSYNILKILLEENLLESLEDLLL